MPMSTAGRNAIAGLLAGSGTAFDTSNAYLGVGDSTTAFAVAQTDLQAATNKHREALDGAPNVSTNVVTYIATFESGDANYDWQEFGLFNNSSGGTMFSRVVSNQGTKVGGQVWELTYAQTIVNGDT